MLPCAGGGKLNQEFLQQMFVFGTKALEQFINRLDEWPQYCNHILQISHLRGTHLELVAYIEGVLARQSHGGNGPVDQLNITSLGATVNEVIVNLVIMLWLVSSSVTFFYLYLGLIQIQWWWQLTALELRGGSFNTLNIKL